MYIIEKYEIFHKQFIKLYDSNRYIKVFITKKQAYNNINSEIKETPIKVFNFIYTDSNKKYWYIIRKLKLF